MDCRENEGCRRMRLKAFSLTVEGLGREASVGSGACAMRKEQVEWSAPADCAVLHFTRPPTTQSTVKRLNGQPPAHRSAAKPISVRLSRAHCIVSWTGGILMCTIYRGQYKSSYVVSPLQSHLNSTASVPIVKSEHFAMHNMG